MLNLMFTLSFIFNYIHKLQNFDGDGGILFSRDSNHIQELGMHYPPGTAIKLATCAHDLMEQTLVVTISKMTLHFTINLMPMLDKNYIRR